MCKQNCLEKVNKSNQFRIKYKGMRELTFIGMHSHDLHRNLIPGFQNLSEHLNLNIPHTHRMLVTSSMEASLNSNRLLFLECPTNDRFHSVTKVRNMSHLHFLLHDMKNSCTHSHFTIVFLVEVLLTSGLLHYSFSCFLLLSVTSCPPLLDPPTQLLPEQ